MNPLDVLKAQAGDKVRVYYLVEDGAKAVGLFNTGSQEKATVTVKWSDLNLKGPQIARDLWRQKDLGKCEDTFSLRVAAHGAELVKLTPLR